MVSSQPVAVIFAFVVGVGVGVGLDVALRLVEADAVDVGFEAAADGECPGAAAGVDGWCRTITYAVTPPTASTTADTAATTASEIDWPGPRRRPGAGTTST